MKFYKFYLSLLVSVCFTVTAFSQLAVETETDADALAAALVGDNENLSIDGAVLIGAEGSAGTFSMGEFGIENGILLTSGEVDNAVGPNTSAGISTGNGTPGDPDLDVLSAPFTTNDATILEITFTPVVGEALEFSYVFGSDEYNEYVCSSFNDPFGFFINGGVYTDENIALLPGTDIPVTINNVNNGSVGGLGSPDNCTEDQLANSEFFFDNTVEEGNDVFANCEYDGLTVVLGVSIPVEVGVQYTIRLAIADAGDSSLDSGVFIEGGSFDVIDFDCDELQADFGDPCELPDGGEGILDMECECIVPQVCDAEGGSIAYADGSESQTICLGEGTELDVTVEGEGEGDNIAFQWVITDGDLNILGLPAAPPFNFDEAGEGTCLIWHLAFDPENSNVLEVAESDEPNAGDLEGCFDLSNSIEVVREDCTPSDCEDYEYYLADILEDGTTNIYEVDLSGSEAALTLKGTSEIEVHIALNEDDGLVYAVSKADGSYRTFDPETGDFGPVEMLDTEVSEIVGAAFNADGKLLILSQSENAIYSVTLGANSVSVFDSYSPSLGGDIVVASDGALYLATREGFGTFYIAIPDEIGADILVGDAPQLVTGVADTEDSNLIFSHRDATTLMVREYDGTPGTPYDITLDGESFMTFNGDLASGCADSRMDLDPCDGEGGDCNAVTAVYVQGTTTDGGAIDPARTNPANSLGAPEGTDELVFTSLGVGGSLTFEFDGLVPNGDGDDITVVETTFNNPGCEDFPEYADVSVSANGEDFFYIGTVCKGDNSVDISDAEIDLDCANFVRVANNDGLSTQPGDGFDVDGIIAIHNCDSDDDGGDEAEMTSNIESNNTLTSFPNPTSGISQAVFVTGQTERATLEVYDMNGRLVEGLFSGVAESGVEYRIDFDGLRLPNGVYMYRLTTTSETVVEKFMIAR